MIPLHKKRNRFWIVTTVLISFCVVGLIVWAIYSFAKLPKNVIEEISNWRPQTNQNESHIEKFTIPFGKGSRKVRAYIPKDYNEKPNETYPTLYLLHGKGGDETDWLDQGDAAQTLDTAISNGTIPPTIVIFPDGNGSKTHHTQYINAADGSELNEDLIYKDLVHLVDQKYRTKNDPKFRAIGGNSAGGFGALNIGLKHQDVFGQIIVYSGYGHLLTYSSPSLIQGSQEVINNNSPLTYLNKLKTHSASVWMMIGKDDSSAFIEDNIQLDKALDKANISNQVTFTEGAHDWNFWKNHLNEGLVWLGTQWRSSDQ